MNVCERTSTRTEKSCLTLCVPEQKVQLQVTTNEKNEGNRYCKDKLRGEGNRFILEGVINISTSLPEKEGGDPNFETYLPPNKI